MKNKTALERVKELKMKRLEVLDKIQIRIPSQYIEEINYEDYKLRKSNISIMRYDDYNYHLVLHDDCFESDERILDAMIRTLKANYDLGESSILKQEVTKSILLEECSIFELELAFDFYEQFIPFEFNAWDKLFHCRFFRDKEITFYSKDYGVDSFKSFIKFYNRSKKLEFVGKPTKEKILRWEFLLRDRDLRSIELKNLNVKFESLKKLLTPILIKKCKKILNGKLPLKHTSTFRILHNYLYSILLASGCKASTSRGFIDK